MTLQKDLHLRQYLTGKEIENVSTRTIDAYDKKIGYFLAFVGKPADQITSTDVTNFMGHLKTKGRSIHYIEGIYRALHGFYVWLIDMDIIKVSPLAHIKKPILPKRMKPFLTEEEFSSLLEVTSYDAFTGVRNTAWLWMLWTTGARFEELATLKKDDLDWRQERIHIRSGKGRKERYIPFTPKAQKAVYKYLSRRTDDIEDLWISEERERMGYWGMFQATRRIYQRAELKKKDIHHIFRRSWAWRQLKAGISPKFVRLVGGWESSQMVDLYVQAMTSEDCLSQVNWEN